jgi:hypothetical protein
LTATQSYFETLTLTKGACPVLKVLFQTYLQFVGTIVAMALTMVVALILTSSCANLIGGADVVEVVQGMGNDVVEMFSASGAKTFLVFLLISLLMLSIVTNIRTAFSQKGRQNWRHVRGWTWSALAESALVGAIALGAANLMFSQQSILTTSLFGLMSTSIGYMEEQPAQEANDVDPATVFWTKTILSVIMIVFFLSTLPSLPKFARVEEEIFREDIETWWDAIRMNLIFGFIHPLFLPIVPIAMGGLLTVVGFWLTYHYWKGGIARSTMYHSLYNLCVIPIIIARIIYLMFE